MDADEVKWMKNTKLEERKEQVKILETSKHQSTRYMVSHFNAAK